MRLALLVLLAACVPGGGSDDKDSRPPKDGADADTDVDSDTDADADTDADTDTDPVVECATTEDVCDAGGCRYDVALDVYTVTGAVTYNGAVPPADYNDDEADFYVRFTGEDGRLHGFSGEDGRYTAFLPAGTYDVVFEFESSVDETRYIDTDFLAAEGVVVSRNTTVDLPLTVYTVTGDVTYNGAVPPADYNDDEADFYVRFTDENGYLHGFAGEDGRYTAFLPAGTYDVAFAFESSIDETRYIDSDFLAMEDVVVSRNTTVDLPLTVHTVTGDVTYNGAVPPADYNDDEADFYVRFTDENGYLHGFSGEDGRYTAFLPSGTYDVAFEFESSVDETRYIDTDFLAAEDVVVSRNATVDLPLTVYTVSGEVTYNGAVPPSDYNDDEADFYVRFTDANGYLHGTGGEDGRYTAFVPAGTYDVAFEFESSVDETRYIDSDFLAKEDVVVSRNTTVDLPLTVYTVTGDVTYNGAVPPADYNDDEADFYVRFTDENGYLHGSSGEDGRYTAFLPAGTYDVAFEFESSVDETLYIDTDFLAAEDVVVSRNATVDLPLVVHTVSGAVSYNGAVPPADYNDDEADFYVRFTDANGYLHGTGGEDGAYTAFLPAGTYDVAFEFESSVDETRYNDTEMLVGECIEVSAP